MMDASCGAAVVDCRVPHTVVRCVCADSVLWFVLLCCGAAGWAEQAGALVPL
jgi:hypothetical protein